ncbi:MAG: GntR family transcriptional regulator [Vannielia sp.]|uniref:GntR family transcriptional regulator n=1 Tax=Rhodobacterales TaxID=204455 RepID=UPI002094505E|nr:GntR family transcriptional regulator [Oceanicola sp. 502str15]MCO6384395.1 FCD domain-containing protein [Oceanicola sp. 502str15]
MALKANKNINPMKKSPIHRPQSLAVTVAERLKEAILRREIALGEPLSEEKIAMAMEVSRTPVREALTLLQMQGLINILPRRGSIVFLPDVEELRALVDYRLHLELLVSRLALERAPEATLAGLRESIALMEAARGDDDSLAYAEADTKFHNVFFENAGNSFFAEAFDIASGRLAALRAHLSAQLSLHRHTTYAEHLEIAEAVENRDAEALARVLTAHIAAMEPNYSGALQTLGERA